MKNPAHVFPGTAGLISGSENQSDQLKSSAQNLEEMSRRSWDDFESMSSSMGNVRFIYADGRSKLGVTKRYSIVLLKTIQETVSSS